VAEFCETCERRETCERPCEKISRQLEPVIDVSRRTWRFGVQIIPASEAMREAANRREQVSDSPEDSSPDPIEEFPNPPSRTASILAEYVKDKDVRDIMAEDIKRRSYERPWRNFAKARERIEDWGERETLEADIRTWPAGPPYRHCAEWLDHRKWQSLEKWLRFERPSVIRHADKYLSPTEARVLQLIGDWPVGDIARKLHIKTSAVRGAKRRGHELAAACRAGGHWHDDAMSLFLRVSGTIFASEARFNYRLLTKGVKPAHGYAWVCSNGEVYSPPVETLPVGRDSQPAPQRPVSSGSDLSFVPQVPSNRQRQQPPAGKDDPAVLLTFSVVAHRLGLSPRWLKHLEHTGEIPKFEKDSAGRRVCREEDLPLYAAAIGERSARIGEAEGGRG